MIERADMLARVQEMMQEELTDKQLRAMMAVAIRGMPLEEAALGYRLVREARDALKVVVTP